MNFNGWVAVPRSILNNTHTGRLSSTEQLVLVTLILLADAKTGSGHINAAAIRTCLPDLKYDTAKRVLKSLEEKRHIYRQIVHASKNLYRYWIHGYQISDGPHKFLWINLSQVFIAKDISDIMYDKDAPETPPEVPPETTPDTPPETTLDDVPNNNKDQDQDNHLNKDQPSYQVESEVEVSEDVIAQSTSKAPLSVRGREFDVSEKVSNGDFVDPLLRGCTLRNGVWYTDRDVPIHPNILELVKDHMKEAR